MTEKELRARYKYTLFGFLWLVANPILQMLVIGLIFPLFVKETVNHYFFYLFTGLLIWNFFYLSLMKATPSIVNERLLIKKTSFPRSVIPLSIILSSLIHYLAAFTIFLIPLAFLGTLSPASILYFFSSIGLLLVFTTGICLFASALNVRFRDINFLVQAILIIWFYATPIAYSLVQIPTHLHWIWRFNPLTSIIQLMQHALIHTAPPDVEMFAYNAGVILLCTLLGFVVFQKENKNFDDWL